MRLEKWLQKGFCKRDTIGDAQWINKWILVLFKAARKTEIKQCDPVPNKTGAWEGEAAMSSSSCPVNLCSVQIYPDNKRFLIS